MAGRITVAVHGERVIFRGVNPPLPSHPRDSPLKKWFCRKFWVPLALPVPHCSNGLASGRVISLARDTPGVSISFALSVSSVPGVVNPSLREWFLFASISFFFSILLYSLRLETPEATMGRQRRPTPSACAGRRQKIVAFWDRTEITQKGILRSLKHLLPRADTPTLGQMVFPQKSCLPFCQEITESCLWLSMLDFCHFCHPGAFLCRNSLQIGQFGASNKQRTLSTVTR